MGILGLVRRKGLFGITWGTPGAETWDYARAWNIGATGDNRAGNVYAQNAVISTAISIFVGDAGTVEWELFAKGSDDDPIESHPVLELLAKPSPFMSGHQLRVGSYLSMKLFGEAWWYYPHAMLGTRGGLRATAKNSGAIQLLDPRSVFPDVTNGTLQWKLRSGGKEVALDSSRLTQFKRDNPYDPIRGLSEIDAIMVEVETDYAAATFNRSFFRDQRGVPTGLLIPGVATISAAPEREEFAKRFNQEAAGGRRHVGIIPPGWDWKDIGVSQRDMEFRSLREYSRELILGAIGVPPFMAGVLDKANYANAREQREAYWMGPQMRFLTQFQETLNSDFLVKLGVEDVVLLPCWETIRSLTENLSEKVDIGTKLFAMGFTKRQINERMELGLEVDDLLDADVGYLPFNVTPVEMVLDPPEPVVSVAAPQEDQTSEPVPARGTKALVTEQQRAFAWRAISGRTRDIEERFGKTMRAHFRWLESEVMANLKSLPGWMISQKAGDGSDLFDDLEARRRLRAAVSPIYRAAMARGIDTMALELALRTSVSLLDPRIVARLTELVHKIVDVDARIKQAIREALAEGIQEGESTGEMAERIRDIFDMSRTRANTIARTEVGSAFSGGRHVQMIDAGIHMQEWLSARDDAVRDSHKIDGQQVAIGETFSNGLRYPNDPNGKAEEVINCRCVALPVVSEE